MKKIVSAGLGVCLVLGQYSFSIQPAHAQISSRISCQNIIQSDLEERSRRLESEAADKINRGEISEGIKLFNQTLQAASRLMNQQEKSLLVERTVEGYIFQESRLGRLIQETNSQQKSQVINFLNQFQTFTQKLGTGYSFNKVRAFTSLATAYRELGEKDRAIAALSQALQTTKFIRGADFQTKSLTPIAQEYLALGRTSEAEKILNQSLQFAKQVKQSDAYLMSQILEPIASTYAKLGRLDQALQVAQTVPAEYYRSQAQSEVIRAYLKNNQVKEAQQLAQKLENGEIKSKSSVEIAIYFANSRQVNFANQAFQQAIDTTKTANLPDVYRQQLIQTYAKAGQRDVALQAAIALIEKEPKAIALNTIAIEYAKAKQSQQVDRVLSLLAPLVQQADAYDPVGYLQPLVETALQEKQFKLAYDLVRNLKDGQSEFVFRVANATIAAGEIDLALQIVRSTDRAWVDLRSQLFGKIATIYAQRNRIDQALKLVQETENAGSSPYRVAMLARIAALAGSRADEIFRTAIAEANSLDSAFFKAQAYGFISRGLLSSNKIDQAEKYLRLAIATAKKEKDPQLLSFNLRTIADHFNESEQFLAALEVVKAIPEQAERNSELGEIFNSLVQREALDQAGAVATEYREPENQTRSLITLAEAWIAANQPQRATTMLTLAFQVAQTVPDPEVRTIQVREDLAVDDDNDRASLLEAIALLYAKVREVDAALQVAQKIQDPKLREPLRQRIQCYRSSINDR